jgi:uncharacterized membrane protein
MKFPYALGIEPGLQEIQMWQAPFPPPQAVCEYEEILPGTWNRMLVMAEEAQAAEILTIRNSQEYFRRDTKRGHVLGTIAMLAAMSCAIYCVAMKQPWAAVAFLSVTVMTVARSLVETARSRGPVPIPAEDTTPVSPSASDA